MTQGTDKYKYCNHHHELTEHHELVNIGGCEFVANKAAIPLLNALNDVGLRTRSHHITGDGSGFVCIMMDNVDITIKDVVEGNSTRDDHNGRHVIISWDTQKDASQ